MFVQCLVYKVHRRQFSKAVGQAAETAPVVQLVGCGKTGVGFVVGFGKGYARDVEFRLVVVVYQFAKFRLVGKRRVKPPCKGVERVFSGGKDFVCHLGKRAEVHARYVFLGGGKFRRYRVPVGVEPVVATYAVVQLRLGIAENRRLPLVHRQQFGCLYGVGVAYAFAGFAGSAYAAEQFAVCAAHPFPCCGEVRCQLLVESCAVKGVDSVVVGFVKSVARLQHLLRALLHCRGKFRHFGKGRRVE